MRINALYNTYVANYAQGIRKEVLNEREYLVVPMTMIVPGVLNGSNGPLLYPVEEVKKEATIWNNVPLVLDHPKENGRFVSARQPHILNKFGLGYVFNSKFTDNKLVAEGWFDVLNTQRIAPSVLESINNGERIELSTGLRTTNEQTPGEYNGVTYNEIARDYRPDHLAILVENIGACSIADGCGVLANETSADSVTSTSEDESMPNRKEMIEALTTNCDCWKNNKGKQALDLMTDEQVSNLHHAYEIQAAAEEGAAGLSVNAGDPNDQQDPPAKSNTPDMSKLTDKQLQDELNKRKAANAKNKAKANNADEETDAEGDTTGNVSMEDWFNDKRVPVEIRNMGKRMVEKEKQEKQSLIEHIVKITANAERSYSKEQLSTKDIGELELLADMFEGFAPTNNEGEKPLYPRRHFVSGTPVNNEAPIDDTPLEAIVMNFSSNDD